jgi:disulfide bond formation protein DsbB
MHKKYFLIALSLLFAALLIGCGGGGGNASGSTSSNNEAAVAEVEEVHTGDAAAGETMYQRSCLACHGADAKGMPNLGKDLTTSDFVQSKTDDELLAFIKVGRPAGDPLNTQGIDMPPKGGNPALSDDDLMNIIAFVRTLEE